MKLYSFSGSCGLASNIVLEWIGKPYDLKLLKKEELATADYHKLNPMGKVPVLDVDGSTLTENSSILNYLAQSFPQAKLDGDGTPKSRAEVNRWLGLINSEMHPAYKPLFGATGYLNDDAAITKTKDHARKELRRMFELCNTRLNDREWLAGSRSIADAYLFVLLMWAKIVNVDLSSLSHLAEFEQRMRADAGVQKALKAEGLAKAA
ncbi:MAG: glutathione S-transferase family protein [Acetobacteraceae bacterium]